MRTNSTFNFGTSHALGDMHLSISPPKWPLLCVALQKQDLDPL